MSPLDSQGTAAAAVPWPEAPPACACAGGSALSLSDEHDAPNTSRPSAATGRSDGRTLVLRDGGANRSDESPIIVDQQVNAVPASPRARSKQQAPPRAAATTRQTEPTRSTATALPCGRNRDISPKLARRPRSTCNSVRRPSGGRMRTGPRPLCRRTRKAARQGRRRQAAERRSSEVATRPSRSWRGCAVGPRRCPSSQLHGTRAIGRGVRSARAVPLRVPPG